MIAGEIVEIIVSAFTGMLSGCAGAIVTLFQVLFMNATVVEGVTTYSGISDFGIWTMVFASVGISFTILRRITHKVVK